MDNLQAAFAILIGVFGLIMAAAFIADFINYIQWRNVQFRVLVLGLSVSSLCLWSAWSLW